MCFTIRLRSNVDLCLSSGCVILAADSPKLGETRPAKTLDGVPVRGPDLNARELDVFFGITAPPQPNFELGNVTDLRIRLVTSSKGRSRRPCSEPDALIQQSSLSPALRSGMRRTQAAELQCRRPACGARPVWAQVTSSSKARPTSSGVNVQCPSRWTYCCTRLSAKPACATSLA